MYDHTLVVNTGSTAVHRDVIDVSRELSTSPIVPRTQRSVLPQTHMVTTVLYDVDPMHDALITVLSCK